MDEAVFGVDDLWLGGARGPTLVRVSEGLLTPVGPVAGAKRWPVSLMPGVIDHHVHLGLVDRALLAGGAVVEVHDLGWDPDVALGWRHEPPDGVTVRVAGPFHTAPGGYPSGRAWAPDRAVRAITDESDARAAVGEAATKGLDGVKVALHSGMALLEDSTLHALVDAAHRAGLPVLVHVEGTGQAARAIDAGADVLVHAPWTERLPDSLLRKALNTTWISTLAIHKDPERAVAIDNIQRFRALGGTVIYGTDMGNGPTPVGPNPEEIRALEKAGLHGDELINTLVGPIPETLPITRILASPKPLPHSGKQLIKWLSTANRLTPQLPNHETYPDRTPASPQSDSRNNSAATPPNQTRPHTPPAQPPAR